MIIEIVRDDSRFGLLREGVLVDVETMVDAHVRVVQLPFIRDERIALDDEAILPGYEDVGWHFQFHPDTDASFHVGTNRLTGMKFILLN